MPVARAAARRLLPVGHFPFLRRYGLRDVPGVPGGEIMRSAVVVPLVLLALAGCHPPPPLCAVEAAEAIESQAAPKSESLEARIYFDATYSMAGFVASGYRGHYVRVLHMLDGAISEEWPGARVRLFHFGNGAPEELGGGRLEPLQTGFYHFPDTDIRRVIEDSDTSGLTVIVTDLFQTDTDVTTVANALIGKQVKAGLAIGVAGVMADFDGMVYDVGIDRLKFQYTGPRPFYLLALGKHADVEAFFRALEGDGLGADPDAHFLIFAPYLLRKLPDVDTAPLRGTQRMDAVKSLAQAGPGSMYVRQFRILGGTKEALWRTYLPLDLNPYRVKISLSSIDPESAIQKPIQKFVGCKPVAAEEMARAVSIEGLQIRHGRGGPKEDSAYQLGFGMKVDSTAMVENTIYRVEVKLAPKAEENLLPDWVGNWDMDVTRIDAWHSHPETFDGRTTLNLKSFLTTLWRASVASHKPALAHFYCYLKRV
jgi:hypothetical protein